MGRDIESIIAASSTAESQKSNEEDDAIQEIKIKDILKQASNSLYVYEQQCHGAELRRSVELYREAEHYFQAGTFEQDLGIEIQTGLCLALLVRFEDERSEEDIEEAIERAEAMLSKLGTVDSSRPRTLRILGQGLALKGSSDPKASAHVLKRALAHLQEAVRLSEDCSSDEAVVCLLEHVRALKANYASLVNPQDLQDAIRLLDKALKLTLGEHRLRHLVLSSRAEILWSLYGPAKNMEGIDDAHTNIQKALPLTPKRQRPSLLNLLGGLSYLKYIESGEPHDLDQAIQSLQLATDGLEEHRALFFTVHGNYYEMLLYRFKERSDPSDLQSGIVGLRSLLEAMPAKHVFRFNYTCKLAKALEQEFSEYGKADSLDAAIEFHQSAIENALPDARYHCCRDLAQAYHTRFHAQRHQRDLDEAVRRIIEAKECCKHQKFLAQLSYVEGDILITRFTLMHQIEDIDAAIAALKHCLEYAHDKDSTHSGVYRSSLGNAFLQKSIEYRNPDDLADAIGAQQEAIRILPQGHHHRPRAYFILGSTHMCKFSCTQNVEDVRHAMDAYQIAVDLTQKGRHIRATYLLHVGKAMQTASETTNNDQDIRSAIGKLQEGAEDEDSAVAGRFDSAVLRATMAHTHNLLESARDAYRLAIRLLPQVAWLLIDHKSRLQWLSTQSTDLCQNAAACALALGAPEEAVEMLDRGRSIIWNTSQNLRADLSSLYQANRALAEELKEVSLALDFQASHGELATQRNPVQDAQIYRRLANRWQELLRLVRGQTGFETFLKPFSFAEVRRASAGGFVAIVNVSRFRCDAILVTADKPIHVVPLADLCPDKMHTQACSLDEALQVTRDWHQERLLDARLTEVLRHLWDALGLHVWREIERMGVRDTPHVWWCPTGVLSRLPIHACGPYDEIQLGMADLVISSYIPTLSALLRAKLSRKLASSGAPFSLLAIGLDAVPDVADSDLPGTAKEMGILKSLGRTETATVLEGPDVTVSRVREMMQVRSWLHVAVHGIQQPWSPLESYLLLYDGRLHLSAIAAARLPHAEFAFMSTCHSAKADEDLPDEALHLAGGLLLAGYRGVMATLWSIADEDGPILAELFYQYLTKDNCNPDATKAAEALHCAARDLRETPGMGLWRWVPFVHLGI